MDEKKELTITQFIEECRAGSMTQQRAKELIEGYYVKGWEDRNNIQRRVNRVNRSTAKRDLDERKDITGDVALAISTRTADDIDEMASYLKYAILDNITTYLQGVGVNVDSAELAESVKVFIANRRNAICHRIAEMDMHVERAIQKAEHNVEQTPLFNEGL